MSYCRWSSDDFQCDLYIYEHCEGGFRVHVAGRRYDLSGVKLPPKIELDGTEETAKRFVKRHLEVRKIIDTLELKPIGLKYDGENFWEETLEDLRQRVIMLIKEGYNCSDGVLETIEEEIEEQIECECDACDLPADVDDAGRILTDAGGCAMCAACVGWKRLDGETCVCTALHHGRYEWTG